MISCFWAPSSFQGFHHFTLEDTGFNSIQSFLFFFSYSFSLPFHDSPPSVSSSAEAPRRLRRWIDRSLRQKEDYVCRERATTMKISDLRRRRRRKVEEELSKICSDILMIIDEHLIPSCTTGESTVFYYKMWVSLSLSVSQFRFAIYIKHHLISIHCRFTGNSKFVCIEKWIDSAIFLWVISGKVITIDIWPSSKSGMKGRRLQINPLSHTRHVHIWTIYIINI